MDLSITFAALWADRNDPVGFTIVMLTHAHTLTQYNVVPHLFNCLLVFNLLIVCVHFAIGIIAVVQRSPIPNHFDRGGEEVQIIRPIIY